MDDRNIIIAVNVSGSGIIAGYIAFDIFYKAYQVDFSSHRYMLVFHARSIS